MGAFWVPVLMAPLLNLKHIGFPATSAKVSAVARTATIRAVQQSELPSTQWRC